MKGVLMVFAQEQTIVLKDAIGGILEQQAPPCRLKSNQAGEEVCPTPSGGRLLRRCADILMDRGATAGANMRNGKH